ALARKCAAPLLGKFNRLASKHKDRLGVGALRVQANHQAHRIRKSQRAPQEQLIARLQYRAERHEFSGRTSEQQCITAPYPDVVYIGLLNHSLETNIECRAAACEAEIGLVRRKFAS